MIYSNLIAFCLNNSFIRFFSGINMPGLTFVHRNLKLFSVLNIDIFDPALAGISLINLKIKRSYKRGQLHEPEIPRVEIRLFF